MLKGKCFLISSTIIIFFAIFTMNTMSNAYEKKELKIHEHYEKIIRNFMLSEEFYKGYKSDWVKKNVPNKPN